jgi:hypothetical protein
MTTRNPGNAVNRIDRNRGALPRLRGRGEQRNTVSNVLALPALYNVSICYLGRYPPLSPGPVQFKLPSDRAQNGQSPFETIFPVHHGLASEAALHICYLNLLPYEKL